MSQAPAMPLFCGDYLADTAHLSLEEHGAYLKLLMLTWRNNGEALPDDDVRIARMLGVSVRHWKEKLRPVLAPFFDLVENRWRQKRLEKEWKFVSGQRQKQVTKAKARWCGQKPDKPLKKAERHNAAGYAAADAAGDAVAKPRDMPQTPSGICPPLKKKIDTSQDRYLSSSSAHEVAAACSMSAATSTPPTKRHPLDDTLDQAKGIAVVEAPIAKTFLDPLYVRRLEGTKLTLGSPTRFLAGEAGKHADALCKAMSGLGTEVSEIAFEVVPKAPTRTQEIPHA
jgi:uncharacterized protein YdaU (DUF1376 family)